MSKQYAHLHARAKTSVKFQNDWPKTVGGVALTSQLLTNGRVTARLYRTCVLTQVRQKQSRRLSKLTQYCFKSILAWEVGELPRLPYRDFVPGPHWRLQDLRHLANLGPMEFSGMDLWPRKISGGGLLMGVFLREAIFLASYMYTNPSEKGSTQGKKFYRQQILFLLKDEENE